MSIKVGDVVYGYAGGRFGRDSYNDKTCIAVGFYNGQHWATFHESRGGFDLFHTLHGSDLTEAANYLTPESDRE